MENNLSSLTGRIPGMPEKKWYEQETRWDLFLPVSLKAAHDQLISITSLGNIKEKNFWNRPVMCTGNITGNFMDITVRISAGRGYFSYHVFGELVGYSNGCLIQVAIRDEATFNTALVFGSLIFLAFIVGGIQTGVIVGVFFGIFATFFFGSIGCLIVLIQRITGMNAVKKALRDIIETPAKQ